MAKITSRTSLNRRFRGLEARIDEKINHVQEIIEDIKHAEQVVHEIEPLTFGELRRKYMLDEDLPKLNLKSPER